MGWKIIVVFYRCTRVIVLVWFQTVFGEFFFVDDTVLDWVRFFFNGPGVFVVEDKVVKSTVLVCGVFVFNMNIMHIKIIRPINQMVLKYFFLLKDVNIFIVGISSKILRSWRCLQTAFKSSEKKKEKYNLIYYLNKYINYKC